MSYPDFDDTEAEKCTRNAKSTTEMCKQCKMLHCLVTANIRQKLYTDTTPKNSHVKFFRVTDNGVELHVGRRRRGETYIERIANCVLEDPPQKNLSLPRFHELVKACVDNYFFGIVKCNNIDIDDWWANTYMSKYTEKRRASPESAKKIRFYVKRPSDKVKFARSGQVLLEWIEMAQELDKCYIDTEPRDELRSKFPGEYVKLDLLYTAYHDGEDEVVLEEPRVTFLEVMSFCVHHD